MAQMAPFSHAAKFIKPYSEEGKLFLSITVTEESGGDCLNSVDGIKNHFQALFIAKIEAVTDSSKQFIDVWI